MAVLALSAAYLLDYLVGDPRRLPHPVRLTGTIIVFLEKQARRIFNSQRGLKAGGVLIVVIIAGGAVVITVLLLSAAYRLHPAAGLILEIYILFTVLAGGDLRNHVARVGDSLQARGIAGARLDAALLVSRDTDSLDESGVARAALESLFENSADGLVAPLLFAAAAGPAAAVLYKTVNTLDSMIGYKTREYMDLGYAAARTDDILSFIPARLTALYILAVGTFRGRGREGIRVLAADRRRHESPNSAWPESAAAGTLGLRFGGADLYHGKIVKRPLINAAGRQPVGADIGRGLALFQSISLLAFFSLVTLAYWIRTMEVIVF